MPDNGFSLSTLQQFVGQELGVSRWITVDQARIDQFADCTQDRQWIHVDVERARRESPFGTTIAHGQLTLALATALQMDVGIAPAGVRQVLNYGFDRVRFIAPVKAGARIRNRVVMLAAEPQEHGRILLKTRSTIEIEGEPKPALVAESLALLLTEE